MESEQLDKFKWDFCFSCDAWMAKCPTCDTNSCSCGCTAFKKCPEKKWWESLSSEECKLEQKSKGKRPPRDELIRIINMFGETKDEDKWQLLFAADPFRIAQHAKWWGLDFEFNWKSQDNWTLKLNSLPDKPPIDRKKIREERKRRREDENI